MHLKNTCSPVQSPLSYSCSVPSCDGPILCPRNPKAGLKKNKANPSGFIVEGQGSRLSLGQKMRRFNILEVFLENLNCSLVSCSKGS
jgi:hypothetical protein